MAALTLFQPHGLRGIYESSHLNRELVMQFCQCQSQSWNSELQSVISGWGQQNGSQKVGFGLGKKASGIESDE